jgi:CYTH domain-containing protein/thymidylate kinase
MKQGNAPVVPVTGGPCSGKTSNLAYLDRELAQKGYTPIFVPEAVTLLKGSGIYPEMYQDDPFDFQRIVASWQFSQEQFFRTQANILVRQGKKAVVITDRGLLDGAAYMPGNVDLLEFQRQVFNRGALAGRNLNIESIRAQYDGVIHLVTAAEGAEEFYTLANNNARTESIEEARIIDHRTRECWLGSGHLSVIGNTHDGVSLSFHDKKRAVRDHIFGILGIPVPIEIEDKFLLERFHPGDITVPFQKIGILQTYLNSGHSEIEERVRKREWHGSCSYYHTIKRPFPSGGGRFETEQVISKRDYEMLLLRRDVSSIPIVKERYCFICNYQYFEIDVMYDRYAGRVYLEREKTHLNDVTRLPSFLRIKKDVTGDPTHSMATLARVA